MEKATLQRLKTEDIYEKRKIFNGKIKPTMSLIEQKLFEDLKPPGSISVEAFVTIWFGPSFRHTAPVANLKTTEGVSSKFMGSIIRRETT